MNTPYQLFPNAFLFPCSNALSLRPPCRPRYGAFIHYMAAFADLMGHDLYSVA